VAIGWKNWVHLGSKETGPKVAAVFSIVESWRRLGLPIRQYLAVVLPESPTALSKAWIN
jgi:transposase